MDQVIVVHFLGVDDVTVLFLAQVGWIDAIRSQEFSVGHAKGLTDGLCDELRLWEGECFWGNYSEERLSQLTTKKITTNI